MVVLERSSVKQQSSISISKQTGNLLQLLLTSSPYSWIFTRVTLVRDSLSVRRPQTRRVYSHIYEAPGSSLSETVSYNNLCFYVIISKHLKVNSTVESFLFDTSKNAL